MDELFAEIQNAAQVIASPNQADIAAVIISIIALAISFFVGVATLKVAFEQKKISEKQAEISEHQNRIALFEKRYEIYELIQDCNDLAWKICTFVNKSEDLYTWYIISRSNIESVENDIKNFDERVVFSQMMDFINDLHQTELLFSNDIADYALSLMIELQTLAVSCHIHKSDSISERIESLKQVRNRYEAERIDDKIVEELRPIIKA